MPGKINPNPTNLEKARRAAGFTRKKLSEKSCTSINTLKAYEQMRRDINRAPLEDALRIADAIGVPIRQIMNDRADD